MKPGNYRARLAGDIFSVLILPLLAFRFVRSTFDLWPGLAAYPAGFAFVLFWAAGKSVYSETLQRWEARSLGTRPIPRVAGRWPGNVDILFKMMRAFKTSYVLDVYRELFEEYQTTTLNLRILWRDNIISMDQEHSKFVLTTGFHRFWRGYSQKERMELFLGGGIFNRDDEAWKQHRNIARPFFARERFSDFEIAEKHSSRLISLLTNIASSDGPQSPALCDIQDLFARFTLDAGSEFLFGKNLDTMSATLPTPGNTAMGPKGSSTGDAWGSFSKAFEMAQVNVTHRARLGSIWPLFELTGDRNQEHVQVIRDYLDPLVQSALEDRKRREVAGVSSAIAEKTFLQHLVENTDDRDVIRDQLLNILLASRDTTACGLTFATYFLATRPDVFSRLKKEILDVCGQTKTPTFEQCRRMKYLRGVINETLRLFPPVPLNVRESRSTSFSLPRSDGTYKVPSEVPLYMPAKTTIMYFPLLTQRNQRLWGEDAEEFDPERWIDPQRLTKFTANPTMYTPFSAGPRICIGQDYAYNQMAYVLARLVQTFDHFSLASEFQPEGSLPPPEWKGRPGRQAFEKIWPASALTLYVKGGLWIRMHPPSC